MHAICTSHLVVEDRYDAYLLSPCIVAAQDFMALERNYLAYQQSLSEGVQRLIRDCVQLKNALAHKGTLPAADDGHFADLLDRARKNEVSSLAPATSYSILAMRLVWSECANWTQIHFDLVC